ncbi:hypothetical protein C8Q79DRAFT_997833 [Trametes meyenii]|nr:hypothetical protein C8Q79DRAFT_997833 [Trametes meyenii]
MQDEEKRIRFVHYRVERDPNGPVLEKNKGPIGFRVPNGFIWAHSIDEFFSIPRVPSVPNYVTTWSRSMLKALGENYDEIEAEAWENPLVPPRVCRPWPVLRLPMDHPAQPEIPFGAIDEGCEFEHSDFARYAICASASEYTKEDVVLAYRRLEPRRCPGGSDPSRACTGRIVEYSGPEPISSAPHEKPYDYVWYPHFRARLEAKASSFDEQSNLILDAVKGMTGGRIVADPPMLRTYHPMKIRAEVVDRGDSNSVPPVDPPASGLPSARVHCGESTGRATTVGPPHDGGIVEEAETHSTSAVTQSEDTDLFSTVGLPKLEEFIPDALFPDTLLVHDPDRTTNHKADPSEPIKYRRVLFRLPNDGSPQNSSPSPKAVSDATAPAPTIQSGERVAHLHIRQANRLGEGHHSYVYRAPLTLPPPLSAHSRTGQATQEHCGFNVVPPCRYPVPVGPVVPKCYGFYLPVGEDGTVDAGAGGKEEGERHSHCYEETPTECFSLVLRLHELNITQGSFYVRNIMIQPGPLSWPPAERTYARPSFRIIDFERARCLALLLAGVEGEGEGERVSIARGVHQALWEEEKQAREELLIEFMSF